MTEETNIWSPCYICLDGGEAQTTSSLVVIQLLMHEIWTWENEMADSDQAAAESVANSQSQTPERAPHEHELLPCHYFDFFYGASHGGVVATLLGRLRLRVDDATERFHRIHQVFSKCKEVLNEVLPLRKVLRMNRYTKDLENAVYDTTTKHPTNPTDRSGTDQPFRDPTSVFATSPLFNPDDPRQAQTCVVVPILIDGVVHQTNHILRTFKCGDEYQDVLAVPLTGRPNLTICQVLRAVMGSPLGSERRHETAPTAFTASYPNGNAGTDYRRLYGTSSSSRSECSPTSTSSESSSCIERSTAGALALFFSIVWVKTGDERRIATKRPLLLPILVEKVLAIFKSVLSPGDTAHVGDSLRLHNSGTMYVRSNLGSGIDRNYPVTIDAPSLDAIRANTVDAVNKYGAFKDYLRQLAKELVSRRRARQAMRGPRWEVFVGNTNKIDDGDGNGKP